MNDFHCELRFANGYGASISRNSLTYGGGQGLVEVAVLVFDGDVPKITYDTPVTNDVVGWLNVEDLAKVLAEISSLPPR